MNHRKNTSNLLDTPILSVLHIDLEVLLYVLLAILAIVAMFYNLGARTQSHQANPLPSSDPSKSGRHILPAWDLGLEERVPEKPRGVLRR